MSVRPTREEFVRLAADHAVVPVWREVLADLETPLSVYAKLAGDGPSFLLESAEHGERWGRYSFVGVDPFLVLRGRDGRVRWEGDPPGDAAEATGPLDALARATRALRAPTGLVDLPLHGGAVGYVGWDAVREEWEPQIVRQVDEVARLWAQSESTLVAVTNEVGLGVVPERRSGRVFRDLLGIVNQRIAAVSDDVLFVVAGRAITL